MINSLIRPKQIKVAQERRDQKEMRSTQKTSAEEEVNLFYVSSVDERSNKLQA